MPQTPSQQTSSTRALIQLSIALCTLVACIAATYVVEPLKRFQPWHVEDGIPVLRLFGEWQEVPEFAGAGGSYKAPQTFRTYRDPVEQEIETEAIRDPQPQPSLSDEDVETPASDVPSALDPEAEDSDPDKEIEARIEDPEGQGMAAFFEALRWTETQEPGAITRISHYGDSSIATDLITYTLRRRFQQRFGDAGHGFMLIARDYLPYRHRDVIHKGSDAWSLRELVRRQDLSGRYGYGGVQFRGVAGAWARFATDKEAPVGQHASRFLLYYQKQPRGAEIRVSVDRKHHEIIDTRSEEIQDAVYELEVPDGPHRFEIKVRGRGQAIAYGAALEREGPGVVYDSLGLVGARGLRLTNFDAEHIQAQLRTRKTNLIILGFGGNEASDGKSEEAYLEDYTKILKHMRFDENISCLVMAPLDQAERRDGDIRTIETIPRIIAAQRRAAFAAKCAFFDTWSAMGGEGSMKRWYRARPRLAMGDFRHATPAGYEIISDLLYDALMAAFKTNQPEAH